VFEGLLLVVREYLNDVEFGELDNYENLETYLNFFAKRATGELPTGA
jgi:hypothetical protein